MRDLLSGGVQRSAATFLSIMALACGHPPVADTAPQLSSASATVTTAAASAAITSASAAPSTPPAPVTEVSFCNGMIPVAAPKVLCGGPTEIQIDLSPLAALTEVRSLRMSRVEPLHTEVVGKLTKLETLELHRLLDARGLETLTELRVLEIPDSKITSLAFVANMPKLRVLDLAFAELQDLEGLRGHPSIEKLVLTWTKVTDLSVLTTLPKLRKLELLGATPSSWAPVGELVRLEELGLSRTELEDLKVLKKLRALRVIDLAAMSKLRSIAPLTQLPELRSVNLRGTFPDDLPRILGARKLCTLGLDPNQSVPGLAARNIELNPHFGCEL